MVRRLAIIFALIFVISFSAKAQDKVEIFGGYSYERLGTSPGHNLNGIETSAQYKFTNWLGLAADMSAHFGSPSGVDTKTLNVMFGPQLSFPARISPFVHLLGGVGHIWAGRADTSFSTAFGGGVDMRIAPLFSWRIIQVDDVVTHFFSSTQNSARISTGVMFRF